MAVVILTGPAGAGKTTLIHAVAGRRPRAAVVDVDDVRWMLVRPHVAPWGGLEGDRQRRLGVRNACCLARNFEADGCDTLVADIVTDATAQIYRTELSPQVPLIIRLKIGFDTARERAALRSYHLSEQELRWVYDEQARFTDADLDLDTGALSVDEAVMAIGAALESEPRM